jgi:cell filamentation protein
MKKSGRYSTSHLIEDQFQPNSRGRVLRNKLGIKSKREMDRIEAVEQVRALEFLSGIYWCSFILSGKETAGLEEYFQY